MCIDETCVDPCADVTCEDGLSCVRGECVDCNDTGCPTGEICRADVCVTDRCATRECGEEMCVDGTCASVCGEGDCPPGQRCAADASCEPDPCDGIACGAGRYCDGGECRADPCAAMTCPRGDVCVPNLGCIDDPCAGVVCPDGRRCVASPRGTPSCTGGGSFDAGVDGGGRYALATGGALCRAAPGRAEGPLAALMVGLIALLLRARRGGGR